MMTLWVQHFEVDITVVSTEHLKFELGKMRESILNLVLGMFTNYNIKKLLVVNGDLVNRNTRHTLRKHMI